MEDQHPLAYKTLSVFLQKYFGDKKCERALEVGCGGGILTRDVLHKFYKKIDLFDANILAVAKAIENNSDQKISKTKPKMKNYIGSFHCSKMQDYLFKH